MLAAQEVWRDIPGYEGAYQASSLGRVKSLPGGARKGVVLKTNKSGRGYPAFAPSINGTQRTRYVHHVVALTFIGPRPDGLDACHNNGDFTDNRPENLRYDTVSGNMRDAIRHGTHRESSRMVCGNGHDLTGDNVRIERNGFAPDGQPKYRRRCRICTKSTSHTTYVRSRDRVSA